YRALVEQIRLCHEKGQPVLVGTVSIEKSELVSRLLKREGIPHNVLNAKNHAREAEIVAQAGKFGAVTISTNMAGRGTDIRLGGNPEFMAAAEMRREQYPEELIAAADSFFETDDEEVLEARRHYAELVKKYKEEIAPEIERVKAAGGLFILGTERHESRRIDNQLRGRSGRQGDVGESRFYLSFEDDLLRLFGTQHIQGLVDRLASDETPIDLKMLSGGIETAQKQLEGRNFGIRSNVLMYDDVMNQQRTIVYRQRREVLDGADLKEKMLSFVQSFVAETVAEHLVGDRAEWDLKELSRAFYGIFGEIEIAENEDADDVCERLTEVALKRYAEQEETFGSEAFRRIERDLLLMSVDRNWMEHIDVMDDLRGSIGLQAYGQRDPVTQYKIVGGEIFEEMNHAIRNETVRNLLTVSPRKPQTERRALPDRRRRFQTPAASDVAAKRRPTRSARQTVFRSATKRRKRPRPERSRRSPFDTSTRLRQRSRATQRLVFQRLKRARRLFLPFPSRKNRRRTRSPTSTRRPSAKRISKSPRRSRLPLFPSFFHTKREEQPSLFQRVASLRLREVGEEIRRPKPRLSSNAVPARLPRRRSPPLRRLYILYPATRRYLVSFFSHSSRRRRRNNRRASLNRSISPIAAIFAIFNSAPGRPTFLADAFRPIYLRARRRSASVVSN
ncbi:MAG: hypothetical protein IJO46_14225, partial [Thermoguttaceae bacterium]|nr:hypothetical protein [Thermoguttaceae bacterium]